MRHIAVRASSTRKGLLHGNSSARTAALFEYSGLYFAFLFIFLSQSLFPFFARLLLLLHALIVRFLVDILQIAVRNAHSGTRLDFVEFLEIRLCLRGILHLVIKR